MKWREPWSASRKQQRPFKLFSRDVLKDAVVWTVVIAAVGLLGNFGEDVSTQLERAGRLWIAPAIGAPLAVFIHLVVWLSPRSVESGPNGIVIVKGDQITLVPWQAIDGYAFARSDGHNVLRINDHTGDSHLLYLAHKVHPNAVERELVKMIGKHPEPTFTPKPLSGSH